MREKLQYTEKDVFSFIKEMNDLLDTHEIGFNISYDDLMDGNV